MSSNVEQAATACAAAVQALYGGAPVAQAQANQWLTSFQQSPEAWHVPFVLLAPEQPEEVQFFAATLLVRKVRSEWTKLDAGSRQGLSQATRAKFDQVLSWQRVGDLVLRQQCALLAALAGASGGDGANELATQALGLLQRGSHGLGLQLLTALAQEAEGLDRSRRLALVNVLQPRAREVLAALGGLLAAASQQLQQGGGGAAEQLAVATLQCAEAWLGLNLVAGSGCILTPAQVQAQQGQLLGATLELLVHPSSSEGVVEAAVQLLLLVYGPDNFSADEQADLAATAALVRALLGTRGRLAGAPSDTLPAGVAKLAAAVAERAPEFCCGQMAEAVALSELVLEVLRRPGPDLAAHTIDYFLMANTVPLPERPEALRGLLYEAVVAALVPHASYPPSFTCWEEEFEVDEDGFARLRDQYLPELLDCAYGLLRLRYLTQAWHLLQGAASWQLAEAALWLLSSVSLSVKARALGGGGGGGGGDENAGSDSAAVLEDRAQTGALLAALFARVCSPEGGARMVGAHPALAQATCRLVEHYASWFGQAGDEPPLQGALQLMLRALVVPQASHTAARSFQQLCLRCGWKMQDAAAFGWLMDAAHGALQQAGGGLPIAERQLVVEGLARVAAGLQGQHLLDAAAHLTAPFIQAARAAAAADTNGAPAPDAAARRGLADNLRLLAAALRHLAPAGDDRGELGAQPALQALAQAGPVLQAVAESQAWQADPEAVAAAVEVYRRAVGTAKQHGLQLAMSALPAMAALFAATAHHGCLTVVAEALEMQHEQPGMAAAAMHTLEAACDTALPRLQAQGLREHPALVSSLLTLAHASAEYAAAHMCASPQLCLLLQLAAAAVRLREADPVSHALQFVGRVAAPQRQANDEGVTAAHLDALHGALAAQGEGLVAALLSAECDTCPRHLMRAAADCLRKLLAHPALGQQATGWLAAAAASGQLPGAADGYLTADDCASFAALAARLQGPRFNALVVDFGLLARGQNTSDVLLAYEF